MIEDKDVCGINSSISKVNWAGTSERERNNFALAMSTLELSKRSHVVARSAAAARLVTLVSNTLLTLLLIFLEVDPGTILVSCLSLQLLLFGLSQLFEYGTNVMVKRSENLMLETLKALTERHPLKPGEDEDMFIL